MAITDTLNLNAGQVAEQNPELHEMRQKFFGQDYLSDIEKGDTGTVQYYTGLGDPNSINYTEAPIEEPVIDTSTPVVDTLVTGGGDEIIASDAGGNTSLEYQGTPGGNTGSGPFDLIDNSGKDYGPYTKGIIQDSMTGDASIAEAIAAQDRQDAFDEQFAFEDPKALAARGIEPDPILPEARPDDFLPEGFDSDFSLEDPGITPIERATQLNEAPVMYSEFDDLEADPGTQPIEGITPEVQSAWEKVKSGASTAGDFISSYGRTMFNLLTDNPVGAAVGMLTQPFTSSESQIEYESYSPETKQAVDQAYGSGGIMEGYNTVSMMGEGVEATIQDRIDTINKTLGTKDSEILEARKTELTNLLNTVQGDKEGQITDRDLSIATGIEAADEEPSAIVTETPTPTVPDFISGATTLPPRGGGADASQSDFSGGNVSAPSGDTYGGEAYGYNEAAEKGNQGGGSGNGGKSIVCTAMYQTTGLEDWSKAMKIWYIYQQKYLTEEHQKGYHKLFKPFVKAMYKNKFIKAIGAHVAKHRTQDLKSIMFGSKSSLLGRIYRKILEPICYWVGKNG